MPHLSLTNTDLPVKFCRNGLGLRMTYTTRETKPSSSREPLTLLSASWATVAGLTADILAKLKGLESTCTAVTRQGQEHTSERREKEAKVRQEFTYSNSKAPPGGAWRHYNAER